jgi:hypothetical protein
MNFTARFARDAEENFFIVGGTDKKIFNFAILGQRNANFLSTNSDYGSLF